MRRALVPATLEVALLAACSDPDLDVLEAWAKRIDDRIVTYDGTTRCCGAYTTIFIDDGTEYCKCCGRDVDGYDMTIPTAKENQ